MDGTAEAGDVRARVLAAASGLIAGGGLAALTTRAVAQAAGVQAPTLYRLFGDKRGLLGAVAEHGLAAFLAGKAQAPEDDPVRELSGAWDAYVAFGLAHPAVFAIMNEIGSPVAQSAGALAGLAILRARVRRIARAGRLAVAEERAVALIHAAGVGVVTTLLAAGEDGRDAGLSAAARDAVLGAILLDGQPFRGGAVTGLAVGLLAHLDGCAALTAGERAVMGEWLGRLAGAEEAG